MRYIDLDLLLGDSEVQSLIERAEETRLAILAAPNKEMKKKLIKDHRDVWVAFRPHFERIFGPKCWYTESKNPGTDDDVDHFRPKGGVAEDSSHGGYWWEALNWRNFRLSCHRANRLRHNPESGNTYGKGEHFPLLQEENRWKRPEDLCRERPLLLDPTDPEDPPHFTFDPTGRIALSPRYEDDDTASKRVQASREHLHLDWPAFVDDRRDLYATIFMKVLDGDRAEHDFNKQAIGAKAMLNAVARDLIRLTRDEHPYSRAAQAHIRRYRDRDWVKRYVLPHILSLPERDHA